MSIGYVGVGSMGGALARRLQLQRQLLVYDLNQAATQRMVEHGSTACASLADLSSRCDVILLCLPTSIEVRTAIFGPDALAASVKPGTLIVDQTSGNPIETRAMAAELAGRGIELIDAPVSGGRRGADNGTIAIMIGATPDQFARIHPILTLISPNVFHAGGVGAGQVIKAANNMISGAQRLVTLEAMALAVKNGINPQTAFEIFNASSGRNYYLEKFVGSHIITGNLASGFTLGLVHKDVRTACQLGADSGVPMFFGNLAREFYQMCMNEWGYDTQVNASALVMDRIAGTHVVPSDYTLK